HPNHRDLPMTGTQHRAARGRTRAAALFLLLGSFAAGTAPGAAQQEPAFSVQDVLTTETVRLAALSDDGRWAVASISSLEDRLGIDNHRYGDPTYVRPGVARLFVVDTRTGERQPLFDGPAQVEALAWSPDAVRLALLVRAGDRFEYRVWDRERNRMRGVRLPGDLVPAVNTPLSPEWTRDGESLILPLRIGDWHDRARAAFAARVDSAVVVYDSEEPFLAWEEVRRLGSLHVLARWDAATRRVTEIVPETMLLGLATTGDGRIRVTEDITEETDYDRIFGTDGKVIVHRLDGGDPVVVIEDTGELGRTVWSDDGLTYAYAKKGKLYVGTVDGEDRVLLPREQEGDAAAEGAAGDPAPDAPDAPDAPADTAAPLRFSPVAFSPDGSRLVASAKGDQYFVDVATGDTTRFLDVDEDAERGPEHRVLGWVSDDAVLVQRESRTEWHRELLRFDVDGGVESLHETRDLLQSVRLSRDGSTVVFAAAPSNHPTDLYAARVGPRGLEEPRLLVDAAPSLDPDAISRTELVSYLDVDGDELYGILHYPLDYDPERRYPTIFYVYEDFFDPGFNTFVNVMTAHGYAVMRPSVDLEMGFPGEAWLKGVTAAANELIRRGVADPDRLAVQGTSYGGYAVNLLVTQTDRFAAGVNVSGKVNMVSFYTDSPRLATRNIHAPENSQDRIGATLWEQPQKYIAHSAIMFADRIDTPLLLIGGDQDHNVPNRQLMEMYFALRRLGKDVTWVSYTHGGHGMPTMTADLVHDYYRRILDFYAEHLAEEDGV
ncbi:MAG: prolyl oligopeptidase family serine peptidase, partial [Gemmatimonadota bacterium]